MALSDEVAQHVLGEIFTLTKNIEEQSNRVLNTKEMLEVTINLLTETDKKIAQSIADIVATGKSQLEARTVAQVALYEKTCALKREAEMQAISLASQEAKQILLKELNTAISDLIRQKFEIQSTSLSVAIRVFETNSSAYADMIASQKQKTIDATTQFAAKLEHIQPLGWIGQAAAITGAGILSAILVFIFK